MLKNPVPCPTLSIRCYRPASRPALSARSKSSKGKVSTDFGRSQGPADSSPLRCIHALIQTFLPQLPPLEDDYSDYHICEEIKAGILMLRKVIEGREVEHREREARLQADVQWEKARRVEVEQQLQELSAVDELKATKELIRLEEEDLQRKMTYIEQRMNETLALRSSFERSVEEREVELKHREASLKREEARVMSRARELHGKEKVLIAFEKSLHQDKHELSAEKETFIKVKSQWLTTNERSQMVLEDCQSRLFELHCMEMQLRRDKVCLDDTTHMLEALHEEIVNDRESISVQSKLLQSEWTAINTEKTRIREAWKSVKMRKEEQVSDPSTEESPTKHPEYRTPYDSWNGGFMSLQPVSFSESPVFARKF